jgi:hypothetical protein
MISIEQIEQTAREVREADPAANAAEFAAAALSAVLVDWLTVEMFERDREVTEAAVLAAHDRAFAVAWPKLLAQLSRQRPHLARALLASLAS